MSIDNPEALVEAFKNSGKFDTLQNELLAEFQKESYSTFRADIGDVVRQRLAKAQMLHYLPQDMVGRDLTQEVERHPIVECAVKDMRMFSDPAFLSKIQDSLQRTLQEDLEKKKSSASQSEIDKEPQSATVQTAIDIDPLTPPQTNEPCLKGILSWPHPADDHQSPASTSRPADDAMDVDND